MDELFNLFSSFKAQEIIGKIFEIHSSQPDIFGRSEVVGLEDFDPLVEEDEKRVEVESIKNTWAVIDTETERFKYFIVQKKSEFGKFCMSLQEWVNSSTSSVLPYGKLADEDVHHYDIEPHEDLSKELSKSDEDEYDEYDVEEDVDDEEETVGSQSIVIGKERMLRNRTHQTHTEANIEREEDSERAFLKVKSFFYGVLFVKCEEREYGIISVLSTVYENRGFGHDSSKNVGEFLKIHEAEVNKQKRIAQGQNDICRLAIEIAGMWNFSNNNNNGSSHIPEIEKKLKRIMELSNGIFILQESNPLGK